MSTIRRVIQYDMQESRVILVCSTKSVNADQLSLTVTSNLIMLNLETSVSTLFADRRASCSRQRQKGWQRRGQRQEEEVVQDAELSMHQKQCTAPKHADWVALSQSLAAQSLQGLKVTCALRSCTCTAVYQDVLIYM